MRVADHVGGQVKGVVYVAYGAPALREVGAAVGALRKFHDYPITVIGDVAPPLFDINYVHFNSLDAGGRWAKLNLDMLSPYDHTLYMDADTRMVVGCAATGFMILNDGYDLVIAPSTNQDAQLLAHCDDADRAATIEAVENQLLLQLQAGVFWFAKNDRTTALFREWREEWRKFNNQDQGALLRALEKAPVNIWLLGWDWNSRHGALIEHLFGRARG